MFIFKAFSDKKQKQNQQHQQTHHTTDTPLKTRTRNRKNRTMKKSSTLTTTTSMPTSPTLSAQTLSASKMSLSSSSSNSSSRSGAAGGGGGGGRASSCQSHGPVRPGSGCVDAIKAKREEIEVDTLLEKAKFYTSVCLGKCNAFAESSTARIYMQYLAFQVRLPYCRCSHFCS